MRSPSTLMLIGLCALTIVSLTGCGRDRPPRPRAQPGNSTTGTPSPSGNLIAPIELAQPTQRLGTAIVVLVDTSGSMSQPVIGQGGHRQPKNLIAQEALSRIIQVTDAWHRKHADSTLYLGVVTFSSETFTVLPMEPFNVTKALQALPEIPPPGGGTAIGLALEAGFKQLYETGCIRKHVVCITDGENTVATPPDIMARQLFAQTKGDVELHFVAFDTSTRSFKFLKDVNGTVDEAANGEQLQTRLTDLYEKRILLEAMPAEKE